MLDQRMNIITILVIVKTIMVKQYAAGIVGTKSVFVENTKKYWVQTNNYNSKEGYQEVIQGAFRQILMGKRFFGEALLQKPHYKSS